MRKIGKGVNNVMMEVTLQQLDETIAQHDLVGLYVYAPMCGTCQLAKRMIEIVEQLCPHVSFCQTDINYMPERAVEWKIESVPCFMLFRNGTMIQKLYAFHSVPYLYEMVKSV